MTNQPPTEIESVKAKIYTIRGVKVMLDRDLAQLYSVTTGNLNKAVKRNSERFPGDFMFQLTRTEAENLIFQNGRSSWGGTRKPPYAFTEQGVAMLSGVLKSRVAVEINIRIMRAFVELRQVIASQPEYEQLKDRIKRIESQMEAMTANNMVDGIIVEKKLTSMSADIRRVSEVLDGFQESYIVIKRPGEGPFGEDN